MRSILSTRRSALTSRRRACLATASNGLDDGTPQPEFTACHQPSEKVTGTEIPAAWFAYGLRLIDIADPRRAREIGHFLPDVPEGSQRVQSTDVATDDRGLFYLLDRLRGLTILERC